MNVHPTDRSEHNRLPEPESIILGTYREMPGLSLNLGQAARLFGLQAPTCATVLDVLVRDGYLRLAPDGQYRRS